jgi:transposase
MSMQRRGGKQQSMWLSATKMPRSPGHVFYEKLNKVLSAGGFDARVEELCEPHYADGQGRPSIEPGMYFRMLFVGYFEGLSSQRGIAWRCADSLSLRSFMGLDGEETSPEHSSMTRIRKRLPEEVFEEVFRFVLELAVEHGLLKGKTIAVDATTLEANAAMKSLVRRDTGEDWKTYLRQLAEAEGMEDPSDEDLRRFDKKRKGKKTSNKDWKSSTDPSSRVTKMKDGRTHLAYKAEHAVDLDSEVIVGAVIHRADDGDTDTVAVTIELSRENLQRSGSASQIEEVVLDKGYHKGETIQQLEEQYGVRPYAAEPARGRRKWRDKPEGQQRAVYNNRRRIRGRRGRRLGRLRSERAERTFAHVCETGGGRQAWLRGVANVSKSHLMRAAAHNLNILMLALFGVGTPRTLQGGMTAVLTLLELATRLVRALGLFIRRVVGVQQHVRHFCSDLKFSGFFASHAVAFSN